jgi:hypothetical protein
MHVVKTIGHQSFTSSALAAVQVVSSELLKDAAGDRANAAWLSSAGSTGAIRFRDDGTVPSATSGIRITPGQNPWLYQGNLEKLRFITEGGIATLDVSYVKVSD